MEAGSDQAASRWPIRGRSTASIVLAVLGGVFVLLGAILLYARAEIIDQQGFADHAAEALADDEVREVVATEIVVQLAERGSADLVAARPLLESVVDTVVDTRQFREVFRTAAEEANRLLFVRDKRNVAVDLADSIEIVRFALQSVQPKLADQIPEGVDVELAKLGRQDFAKQSLVVADEIRLLGIVAPLLAVLALIASVVASPDRRAGVLRAALAIAVAGTVLAIALIVLRARVVAGSRGEDELTDEQVQGAVGGIIDAFLGDLLGWALLLALGGLVVAGAAAALDPERTEDPVMRVRRRLTERPRTTAGRVLRGVAAIAAGFLLALDADQAVAIIGLLAGAYLVYFGAGELLLLLQPPETVPGEGRVRRKRELARAGLIAGAVVVAAAVAVIAFTSGDAGERRAAASPPGGCNGSVAACDLRLNEAVFAGTHNSFSAADSPGWFISNQRHTIERQLEDGIRLFLIDPHWGVAGAQGRVRTDFEAEQRDRNRVASSLPPKILAAAERLAGSLGLRGQGGGEAEVFLCHSVCELGAVRMVDELEVIRDFLDANPGEVVILFIEPYVEPAEIESVFEEAGLIDQVATIERGAPLPTLGELVRDDRRVIVFTERDADGSVPWYLDGFSFVQDTPLGATEPDELSCDLNRGDRGSPMLMLNHWADVFPPRRGANVDFQTRKEILDRARRCARERGLPVSLIAVDHYDLADLVDSVEQLNRERIKAARRRTTE
ncbi:MAG: hypothetical protein K0R88_603 [Solirubrobacterales bacterium]|jgi:hypothetical protein|nr:hypothetical protein [Solirubrobacterales bacterium]